MTLATIVVIASLVLAGAVVIGLESGALTKDVIPYAVGGLGVLIVAALTLFFLVDARGKIEWGSPLPAEDAAGGESDTAKKRSGGDGEITDDEAGGGADKGNQGAELDDLKFRSFKDCAICPVMIAVAAGNFVMGSPRKEPDRSNSEGPQREIKIQRRFAVSQMEITRAEYKAFVTATNHATSNTCIVNGMLTAGANYLKPGFGQESADPVVCVGWNDAKAYTSWLSAKTGKYYRLLSEAEWEYIARAGIKERYSIKGGLSKRAANYANVWSGTVAAGTYSVNPFGFRNVHGNVAEWVEDCWHDTLLGHPPTAAPWLEANEGQCGLRSVRGGGWDSDASELRSAARSYNYPTSAKNSIGIRVAKDQ